MTIILVEVDPVVQKPEMSFAKPVVIVGREAGECDIAFDKAKFPMVSRRHAEFRCENGQWMLADLGSSYGVFVNGQRVSAPHVLSVGNKVQFGTDGPTVVVIWFEAAANAAPAAEPPARQAQPFSAPVAAPPPQQKKSAPVESWEMGAPPVQPAVQQQPAEPQQGRSISTPPAASPPRTAPPKASLVFVDEPLRPPYQFAAASVWLGRDPECSVVIDSESGMVSRRHAEVRFEGGSFVLEDNKSFNGTLVNDQRISAVTPIYHGDKVRLGVGGPVLRFDSQGREAPKGASLPGQRAVAAANTGNVKNVSESSGSSTMVLDRANAEKYIPKSSAAQPQLLMSVVLGDKPQLTIGRDEKNDIRLDGLQISNRHARFVRSGGGVAVEDLKSTNGVYVNGARVTRQDIGPQDSVQIGAFVIAVDTAGNINVFDTRSRTRLDVVDVFRQVKDRSAGGQLVLLDNISLSIQPNEFVGVLGPSGAGKSMLMEVMNGMRSPDGGSVLLNNQDLHRHLDSLKQFIGYVPQDDIIHRELTVFRTLYYVAKMRLSRDVSSKEIRQIVDEVLDVTGLTERRNLKVSKLSGGQRKRVSIAVELITKPSVIFLDEPTSGLDPGAEERIMKLFRQIAESGRTVIMTTHAMENVKLFDKIVVLMGGKLVFYGKPEEALVHLKAANFKELYARLERPVEEGVREHGEAHRRQITDQTAEERKTKFRSTPQYRDNIQKPLGDLGSTVPAGKQKKRRLGIFGSIGQWSTLSRRYFEVLFKDKLTLFILFAQAPIIALMTFFVMGSSLPRDFVYFVLALVAMWFGTSVSAREIVRERPIYKRERMVNLGLLPYLASKLFVIGVIVTVQCLMLFVPLKIFDIAGLMAMPGETFGLPQLWAMLLTAAVGMGVGLFVSGLVRTPEMATSLVPLILIPQILFSGIVGVPHGIVSKAVSMTMPAAWSFDTMKRFSTLDTLEAEGANPKGKTRGLGLYKYVETENEKIIAKAKQDFEDYKRLSQSQFQDGPADAPDVDLTSAAIKKVPDDLSSYVTFFHPWMNEVLNQIVLMLMFWMLAAATLIVLRLRDN
ncbi:MAG: FHA domain-containing protein [Acidobacteria bacterium]|nr:FHA domain-containing protein [Acidobacteriota bacterium]